MRKYIDLIEQTIQPITEDIDWNFIEQLHGPRGSGFWVTPNTVDIVLPHGIHDQLCYRRFPMPGDTGDPDMIPWTARALEAGWIRGRSSKGGEEMNIMFVAGPKVKPALKTMETILKAMDVLENIYLEYWKPGALNVQAGGPVSPQPQQLHVDTPSKVIGRMKSLISRS